MEVKEILKLFDGFHFDISAHPVENDPDITSETEVNIKLDGLKWFVWLAPDSTEVQCYDLPNGGYDGLYINSADELLDIVLTDFLTARADRRAKHK